MPSYGLPNPEEMREMLLDTASDRTRITLTVKESVLVLGYIALVRSEMGACDVPECEACNATNALFWEISNALPMSARVSYQRAMRESGIELPPAPWEIVATR